MSRFEGAIGKQRSGTMGGFVAIVLWSTTVAFARSLSEQLGPVTASVAVYCVSGAIAVIRLLLAKGGGPRIRELPVAYLAGCGALFVSYTLLLFLSVGLAEGRQQVLEVGLLNYLWPALTISLSVVLLKKRARLLLFPATLLALSGVVLVLTQGAHVSWQSFCLNLAGTRSPIRWGWALRCAGLSIPYWLGGGLVARKRAPWICSSQPRVASCFCSAFSSTNRAPGALAPLQRQYSWEWPRTWRTGCGTLR